MNSMNLPPAKVGGEGVVVASDEEAVGLLGALAESGRPVVSAEVLAAKARADAPGPRWLRRKAHYARVLGAAGFAKDEAMEEMDCGPWPKRASASANKASLALDDAFDSGARLGAELAVDRHLARSDHEPGEVFHATESLLIAATGAANVSAEVALAVVVERIEAADLAVGSSALWTMRAHAEEHAERWRDRPTFRPEEEPQPNPAEPAVVALLADWKAPRNPTAHEAAAEVFADWSPSE